VPPPHVHPGPRARARQSRRPAAVQAASLCPSATSGPSRRPGHAGLAFVAPPPPSSEFRKPPALDQIDEDVLFALLQDDGGAGFANPDLVADAFNLGAGVAVWAERRLDGLQLVLPLPQTV